jgi:Tol biopolymer transport system component
MRLESGTRLGPYEITGQLGAGGMGEVCRARDTKLNREVALKVLPEAFASDPERMARFHREAQVLATLNHPNIAAIYGFEDGPPKGGPYADVGAGFSRPVNAIVMELIEGETLAALIERGPVPLDEALQIAKQIAEALEYAHERGVIHRDLKPANVKVTPDGTVKVLDFGLAKALGNEADSSLTSPNSMSPTLSLAATYAGVILGTAAYMAPEQAKGKGVDRRADVWAFGVVLYEMLSGARMFGGDSIAETLASVMKDQITCAGLPAEIPTPIRRLVARCLERDVRRRLQSIGEARIVIDDVIAGAVHEDASTTAAAPPVPPSRWPWAVAALGLLAAVAVGGWAWSRPGPPLPAVARFTWTMPAGLNLTAAAPNAPMVAVSPDGRFIVFAADEAGRARTLWVRAIDSLEARRLDRTEGARFPFWSPDSRHIAYFVDARLMRVAIAGGAPLVVCEDLGEGEGGTWFQADGQDGVIVFAPDLRGPLHRVPATGGKSQPFTTLAAGETSHSFPQFLPGGGLLYLAEGTKTSVFVQRPGVNTPTFIADVPGRAMFAPPGYLLYMRDNTLLAHRWNLDTLRLEGEPVAVADGVRSGVTNGRNAYSVSTNGVLAYRAGSVASQRVQWYTREGKPDGLVLEPDAYGQLELAPDGSKFVIVRGLLEARDLWVQDLVSGVFSRLTTASGPEGDPVWSPDSRSIAYLGLGEKELTLYETVLGSGTHTALASIPTEFPSTWTANGNTLLLNGSGRVRLFPMRPTGGTKPILSAPVLDGKYVTDQHRVSPDGAWVAFMSQESGQPQIAVATFPSFGQIRQISNSPLGAVQPLWRADGRELFFLDREGSIKALDVRMTTTTFETGPIRTLFSNLDINPSIAVHFYAVSRDGQRFLLRETPGLANEDELLYVVTNWTSLLPR